jgi:hypothetical protein
MSNIFNNIKVLTDLEVKNTATMNKGLIVSGSASGSTGLHVKEDARIDGELYIGGQVINRGYAQIGALVVEGLTSLSGNLFVTGSETIDGNLTVKGGTFSIDGNITGSFDVKANGDISGSTGHYGNLTAGTISVDSLYLPGQLGVSGSTQLGANNASIITVAGQLSASAGIEVTTGGFNAANGTGYKLKGTEALKEDSGLVVLQSGSNKVQLGNLGYGGSLAGAEGIKVISKDATAFISARTFIKLNNVGAPQIDISSDSSKLYSTAGDVLLSASTGIYAESDLIAEKHLKLSGSANFKNISSVNRDANGLYDVAAAISALDDIINTEDRNYGKMRFAYSGSIGNTTQTLNLVDLGADSVFFGVNQLNYLVADVMIRINSSEAWTNDLTSVQIYNDNGSIMVDLDVPAAEPGWEYRIIIVNENGEMFI